MRLELASNGGHLLIILVVIVGRICMDYCLLDCLNSSLAVGDTVSFWGTSMSPNDVAESINTIPYTLMTGVNKRVRRVPIQSNGHKQT